VTGTALHAELARAAALAASVPESPDAHVLRRAFEEFSDCANQLRDSFAGLRAEVRALAAELEEKNRIIEALERQAARNERIAAMGEMAERIAHQIRNPLGTIDLYASMLAEDLAGTRSADLATRISNAVRATDLVVGNLLTFADDLDPVRAPVCVHELLAEVEAVGSRVLASRAVRIDVSMHAEESRVLGDRDLLKQAILNLVTNAGQAVREGEAIRIHTSNRRLEDDGATWLTLGVIDEGEGIEPGDLERVFDPLFSTRRGGAGIGLAIVQRVAEAHGGLVEVESARGEGTTVRLSLPSHPR
jgi:signal transduction histidine kinase